MANEQANANLIPWYYRRWVWGTLIILMYLFNILYSLALFSNFSYSGIVEFIIYSPISFDGNFGFPISDITGKWYPLAYYFIIAILLYFGFKKKKVNMAFISITLIILIATTIGIAKAYYFSN